MPSSARLVTIILVLTACGGGASVGESSTVPPLSAPSSSTTSVGAGCADVIDAVAEPDGEGTFLFRVTVRSADTGLDKYADLWEVRAPDGAVLGERVLLHPHVDEQPFTRTLAGVAVPPEIEEVVIAARDSVVGFCGAAVTVPLG